MPFAQIQQLLAQGLLESLYMLLATAFFACALGLPLGIILYNRSAHGLAPQPLVYKFLSLVVNILRSVPFLILMVYLIPLTRAIVGTSIGPTAAIIPLTFSTAPFVGRLVESSLREVPTGVIDAARSMGASRQQILWGVLLSEAKPSILSGSIITAVNIISYSAMAGFIGGGGLGAIAINYGYNRYNTEVMTWTVILIVTLVQLVEGLGNLLLKIITKH